MRRPHSILRTTRLVRFLPMTSTSQHRSAGAITVTRAEPQRPPRSVRGDKADSTKPTVSGWIRRDIAKHVTVSNVIRDSLKHLVDVVHIAQKKRFASGRQR